MKRWQVAEPIPQSVLDAHPDLHPVLLQVLWNRGLREKEAFERFLAPDWERDTFDPWIFSRMREAVDRAFRALEAGETIAVHGDYDADGVCGSAVLISTLREVCRAFGWNEERIISYIPHRETEGYGLSVETAEHLVQNDGATLIMSVDCGISNKEAIDRARSLGAETIVCDHHAMPTELPEAILLHPQVPGEPYPNKVLCGTAVAFKFASALIHEARRRLPACLPVGKAGRQAALPEGHEKWLLDLVAIATVTDVMPLLGENRALEHYGLLVLNKTRRPGLRKLLDVAGAKAGELDTVSIGFVIGPRLNAAGRMEHADLALDLLLEEDEARAFEVAERLHRVNAERQKASNAMYEEAKRMIGDPAGRKVLVVAGEGWSPGLVGLVAGKLVQDFGIPAYVVGKEGERHVGSGRSAGNLDVTAALHAASEHLDKFGGHPQACGFSVTGEERFAAAAHALEGYAEQAFGAAEAAAPLMIDAEVALEDADRDCLEALRRLAPFGEGNREPVLCVRGLTVAGFDTVGADGAHLRLTARSPRGTIAKMIGFRFGSLAHDLRLGAEADIAFGLGENTWNGRTELQMRIIDIKL